jgi:hypothetical protein
MCPVDQRAVSSARDSPISIAKLQASTAQHASRNQSEENQAKLKQQQQAREDSIKQAGEEEAKKKFENKQAMQDSLSNATLRLKKYL